MDYTAIYETGESIAEILRKAMCPEPVAQKEHIGVCEPQSPEDYRLTVWIYNIEEQKDAGVLTGYAPDAQNPLAERFAPMRLRLHMLVSAHSKAPAIQKYADEYRIIGKALQTLRDTPSIPAEFLSGTLSEQTEPITLEIRTLNAEEMSRVWNNTQKTIRPSFGLIASGVLIKSNRVRETAPHVVSAEFYSKQKRN